MPGYFHWHSCCFVGLIHGFWINKTPINFCPKIKLNSLWLCLCPKHIKFPWTFRKSCSSHPYITRKKITHLHMQVSKKRPIWNREASDCDIPNLGSIPTCNYFMRKPLVVTEIYRLIYAIFHGVWNPVWYPSPGPWHRRI